MPSSTSNIVTYISRDHPRYSFDRSVPSVTAAAKSPVNPLADIRVVSSDGVVFPTQKLFLLAASDVFADMLATGSDAGSTSGNPSELPQVKLNETSKDLGVFLGFVDRKIVRPQLLSLEQAEKLLQMADMYDAPVVMDVARLQAVRFVSSSAAVVFGLAVAYGSLELAQEALKHFDDAVTRAEVKPVEKVPAGKQVAFAPFVPRKHRYSIDPGSDSESDMPARKKRMRDASLSDVPIHYLERFSMKTIQNVTQLQDDTSRSWVEKASSFKIA